MSCLVSIITPLHNKGAYIKATIDSVLNQCFANWELIIVENHSVDEGPDVARKFAEYDPRIRYCEGGDDIKGPGAARNFGLRQARGDWVLFLDADDLVMPEHIQSLVEVAFSETVDVAASHWLEFSDGAWDGGMDHLQQMTRKEAEGNREGRLGLEDTIIAFAPWAIHCGLVRRSRLCGERLWLTELDPYPSEDTAFWFRVLYNTKVAYTEKFTAVYRTRTQNFRNEHDNLSRWFEAMIAVTERNVAFVQSENRELTAKQCESLMRLWENIAKRALATQTYQISDNAAKRAEAWLLTCCKRGGIDTWPLRIRRWLGIKHFLKLSGLISHARLLHPE